MLGKGLRKTGPGLHRQAPGSIKKAPLCSMSSDVRLACNMRQHADGFQLCTGRLR